MTRTASPPLMNESSVEKENDMNLKMELSYAKWLASVSLVRTGLLLLVIVSAYDWGCLTCLSALAEDLPRSTEKARNSLTPVERLHPEMVICCILLGLLSTTVVHWFSLAWLLNRSQAKLFVAKQDILARGILACGTHGLTGRRRAHLDLAALAYSRASKAGAIITFDYPREQVSAFGVVVNDGIEQLRLAMETSSLD